MKKLKPKPIKKTPFDSDAALGYFYSHEEKMLKTQYNLLYHITPLKNKYHWNLNQIVKRLDIFKTGKVVFAVAQGKGLEDIEKVKQLLPNNSNVTVFPIENDLVYRETVSLLPLLQHVQLEKDSYTFYAHTKGITRGNQPAIKIWTEAMYEWNLDNMLLVYRMLKKYPVVGCFKRYNAKCKDAPAIFYKSTWHYSGTFWWFRNNDLFAKRNWQNIPLDRYGTEVYLSWLFKSKDAGVLIGDDCPSLYRMSNIRKILYA